MKGILAVLLLCATSQFAHGDRFSTIHTYHGLLGPKLLVTTASVLSVIGSAYSGPQDLQPETQSLIAGYNGSENAADLLHRDSFASSFAGPDGESFAESIASSESDGGDGDGFAQSTAFSGFEAGESFARSNSFSGGGNGDGFAESIASSGGGNADSFAQSSSSGGVANAIAVSGTSPVRKPPCRKPGELVNKSKEFSMFNESEYRCYHVGEKAHFLSFKVKTAYSAYIALLSNLMFRGPTYEVFLGGWGNTQSAVKDKFEVQHYATLVGTPDLLSNDEFRGFWIRWDEGVITVGKEGKKYPFMAHAVPDLYEVKYVCFFAGSRSASWIIEGVAKK